MIVYLLMIRLWGDEGQLALQGSHVCLMNATCVGTEILKSLVLAGIGSFTIIDANKITGEDAGSNFFLLDDDSVGKSRAKVATQMLLELNPDVSGDFFEETAESLLESNERFFTHFSLVVMTGFYNEKTFSKLSRILWEANIPLIVCKTIGFIGSVRLQIKEHAIIEAHPDHVLEDLRLDEPFSELKAFFDSYVDFNSLSRKDLSHTPFLIVLYKYLQVWRQTNDRKDNELPKTYREKEELKRIIRSEMTKFKESKKEDESSNELDLENFEEAIKAVNTVLNPSNIIPASTQQIFNDSKVDSPSSTFWFKVKALKEFVSKNNNRLPVRGTIPDMTSDSAKYIQIQKIFSAKSMEDSDTVYGYFQTFCNHSGRPNDRIVTENDMKTFCKNAHCLNLIRTSMFETELTGAPLRELITSIQAGDETNDELVFYLLLRSVDRFYSQNNRLPGSLNDQLESDISLVKVCIHSYF